jgi:hypothetical protein
MHTFFQGIADSRVKRSGDSAAQIFLGTFQPSLAPVGGGNWWAAKRETTKQAASAVATAHADFVATLTGAPPRTIPLEADSIDIEDRADHLSKVLGALSAYVAVILDDTAQNVPGTLDLPDVEAILADLTSDVTGAIQHAAEGMDWRDE